MTSGQALTKEVVSSIVMRLAGPEPRFRAKKTLDMRGAEAELGVVNINGKNYDAVRVTIPRKGGYISVQEQRFDVGDKIKTERGDVKTIANVKKERQGAIVTFRYTFADRSWARDLSSNKRGNWTTFPELIGKDDPFAVDNDYRDSLTKHEDRLQRRREQKGDKLQRLVDEGILSIGMEVHYLSGKGIMMLGEIKAFNFNTGRVLVLDPWVGKRWVDHLWDGRNERLTLYAIK